MATAARNSVFGETALPKESGTEPPTADTTGKGTAEAPYDPGNAPEMKSAPRKEQSNDAPSETLPTSSEPTSKLDNPDPASTSDMKAAVSAADANTNPKSLSPSTAETAETAETTETTEHKTKKPGTAKPGSHSALFGLGPDSKEVSPPKSSGKVTGTIDEAAEAISTQATNENKGAAQEETGGYVGLKKAAMEEEVKHKSGEGESKAPEEGDDERESRSRVKKPSVADSLGRDISPGEMPDGTHRKSIAEGMPIPSPKLGFGRSKTDNVVGSPSGDKSGSGGFRDRLKDKFRSKK